MEIELVNFSPAGATVRSVRSGKLFYGTPKRGGWVWRTEKDKTPTAREVLALAKFVDRGWR